MKASTDRALAEQALRNIEAGQALTDRDVSAITMQIRIDNGGASDTCPTCCCPRDRPYRHTRWQTGEIDEGCIDASHTEDLLDRPADDADRRWHERPEAVEMRLGAALRLRRVTSGLDAWREARLQEVER